MKRVIIAVAAVALLLIAGSSATAALWNDSETIEGATIDSGTLNLTLNGQAQTTIGPFSGLYPGGVVATKLTLAGHASGNLGLAYTLTSSLTNSSTASSALYGVVDAQVYAQPNASASCTATATPGGTQIYGTGGGFADLAALSATRTLVNAASVDTTAYLCVRLTIPTGTASTAGGVQLSGATTAFALTFTGQGTR